MHWHRNHPNQPIPIVDLSIYKQYKALIEISNNPTLVLEFFTTSNFLIDMGKFIEKILLFKCLIIQSISMLNNKKAYSLRHDESYILQQSILELFVSAFDRFDWVNEFYCINAFHVHVIELIPLSISKKDKKKIHLSIFQLV